MAGFLTHPFKNVLNDTEKGIKRNRRERVHNDEMETQKITEGHIPPYNVLNVKSTLCNKICGLGKGNDKFCEIHPALLVSRGD